MVSSNNCPRFTMAILLSVSVLCSLLYFCWEKLGNGFIRLWLYLHDLLCKHCADEMLNNMDYMNWGNAIKWYSRYNKIASNFPTRWKTLREEITKKIYIVSLTYSGWCGSSFGFLCTVYSFKEHPWDWSKKWYTVSLHTKAFDAGLHQTLLLICILENVMQHVLQGTIMFSHCWSNCGTRKQTRLTYSMVFLAFGNVLLKKKKKKGKNDFKKLLTCSFTVFLADNQMSRIYVVSDQLSLRKPQIKLFTSSQLLVFQHWLFIYDQHERNRLESSVTFGQRLIIFFMI